LFHKLRTMQHDGNAALSVTGIRKTFGTTTVLHDVSLQLPRGEFVTLLGPSGCGKTTLLRLIAGLDVADAGQIYVHGQNVTGVPANKRPVNTVFQHYALFPHLSVYENIAFGLRSRRFPEADIKRRVTDALNMLQLEPLAKRKPDQLSGGQKQRVAVARALVNEPAVLLLDEPLSALDAQLRSDVQVELRRLQKRLGTTFLLVTHDQDEALSVSDRIVVMDHGHIVQQGAPQEMYDRPKTRFIAGFLGAANIIPVHKRNHEKCETPLGPLIAERVPAWDTGNLAIHPERIVISTQNNVPNTVQVTIVDAIYRGDHVELHTRVADIHLRIQTDAGTTYTAGSSIYITLPTTELRVLDD
jgi:spermidine/putrescine transport system ATP-binding protein